MPNLFEHMLDFADVLLLPLLALFFKAPMETARRSYTKWLQLHFIH